MNISRKEDQNYSRTFFDVKSKKREADPNDTVLHQEYKKAESNSGQSVPASPQVQPTKSVAPLPIVQPVQISKPNSPPTPTMSTPLSNSSSNGNMTPIQSPLQTKSETGGELQVLKVMNEKLVHEVSRLSQQQEVIQTSIKSILEELILSRREQQDLQLKVHELSSTVQDQHAKQVSPTTQSILQSLQSLQSQRLVNSIPSRNPTQMALSSTPPYYRDVNSTNFGTRHEGNEIEALDALLVGPEANLLSFDALSLQQVDLNSPGGTSVTGNNSISVPNGSVFPYGIANHQYQ